MYTGSLYRDNKINKIPKNKNAKRKEKIRKIHAIVYLGRIGVVPSGTSCRQKFALRIYNKEPHQYIVPLLYFMHVATVLRHMLLNR